ncbi:MAG: hypothetical protein LBO09_03230 [Candidatus Peribacteria bacterium]|jgi:hypothetical protein|nr:hypothetical protein [Candidatus Peribacteria bacterium]
MTTANNHTLYPRWKEKNKRPAAAFSMTVRGQCKRRPGAPDASRIIAKDKDYSDFASCVGFLYVYDYHRSVRYKRVQTYIRE